MGSLFFRVAKDFRGRGLMRDLLTAAINWAGKHRVRIVEAYPVETESKLPAWSIYTGVVPVFRATGFVEVLRRSEKRPIMRKTMEQYGFS